MDWFRWHHGSVTDPKFQLVAKKAKASVAEVVAVWAYLLETASQNPKRGQVDQLDGEAIDLALGMDDGTTDAILAVLSDRGLLADGRVAAWDKRQPKREDETASDRQRRKREREHELALASAVTGDASRNVTQCHAPSRTVTPEEKREEEIDQEQDQKPSAGKPPRKSKRDLAAEFPLPEWVDRALWVKWIAVRNKPEAGLPENLAKLTGWRQQGIDPARVLLEAIAGGWQGLYLPKDIAHENRGNAGGKLSAVERVQAAIANRHSADFIDADFIRDDRTVVASHG